MSVFNILFIFSILFSLASCSTDETNPRVSYTKVSFNVSKNSAVISSLTVATSKEITSGNSD